MMNKVYNPVDKVRRFLRILVEHPVFCVVGSLLLFCVLYSKIRLDEFRTKVRDDILIIACEMTNEIGPHFLEAAKRQESNINRYVECVAARPLLKILFLLPGIEDPTEVFDGPLKTLQEVGSTEKEAARAIWSAGEQLLRYRVRVPTCSSRISLHSNVVASSTLQEATDKAIKYSEEALAQLKLEQTFENAVELCEANRTSVIFVFVCRFDYGLDETIEKFLKITLDAADVTKKMSEELGESDPRRPALLLMEGSEVRRSRILKALSCSSRDYLKAYNLLWDEIDGGVRSREAVMKAFQKYENGLKSERDAVHHAEDLTRDV